MTHYLNFIKKSCLLSVVAICALSIVSAQTNNQEQEAPANVDQSQTRTVVVADINVGDVKVEEKNGVISGTFSLQGKKGQQNDIVYGIVAIGEENQTQDVKVFGRDVSVKQGEVKMLPFTYTLPSSLSGDVKIFLRAETSGGLPLGAQKVFEKKFSTMKSQLSCIKSTDKIEFSCIHKLGGKISIEYYSGSYFGNLVGEEDILAKPNISFSVKPNLNAGAYTVIVRDINTETEVFSLRVPGVSGLIKNVSLYQGKIDGLVTGVVTAMASPMNGANLQISLTDSRSECGRYSVPLGDGVVEFSVDSQKCGEGVVVVTLKSADGTVLSSVSQPFSVKDVRTTESSLQDKNNGSGSNKNLARILVSVVLFVGIILCIVYFIRRNKNVVRTAVFALISFSLFSAVQPVNALTLYTTSLGYKGEIGYYIFVGITSDKSSYVQGGDMVITSSMNVFSDAGAGGSSSIKDSSVAWNSAGGGSPEWDSPWPVSGSFPVFVGINDLSLPNHSSAGPFFGPPKTFTIPVSMTVGSHYFANRLIMNAYYPPTPGLRYRDDIGNFSFDVYAPSVNVFFSQLMQKIKDVFIERSFAETSTN